MDGRLPELAVGLVGAGGRNKGASAVLLLWGVECGQTGSSPPVSPCTTGPIFRALRLHRTHRHQHTHRNTDKDTYFLLLKELGEQTLVQVTGKGGAGTCREDAQLLLPSQRLPRGFLLSGIPSTVEYLPP